MGVVAIQILLLQEHQFIVYFCVVIEQIFNFRRKNMKPNA